MVPFNGFALVEFVVCEVDGSPGSVVAKWRYYQDHDYKENTKTDAIGELAEKCWQSACMVHPNDYQHTTPRYAALVNVQGNRTATVVKIRRFEDEIRGCPFDCDKFPAASLLKFLGAESFSHRTVELWSVIKVEVESERLFPAKPS